MGRGEGGGEERGRGGEEGKILKGEGREVFGRGDWERMNNKERNEERKERKERKKRRRKKAFTTNQNLR